MLQLYKDDLLIVGVTRGNIDRLTAHKPMRITLAKGVAEIMVVFGETKPDIIAELEQAGVQFKLADKDAALLQPE